MNIYQKTIATACLCLAALSIQAQTQVIAHRGLLESRRFGTKLIGLFKKSGRSESLRE